MKKNLYFRTVLRRENLFLNFIYSMFAAWSSYPRLLLEVFIRKDFGERYFKLASAITVALILIAIPLIPSFLGTGMDVMDDFDDETGFTGSHRSGGNSFLSAYLTWYIFIALFIVFSIFRYKEILRNPSVFDFKKYSLYSGKIHPAFKKLFGKEPSIRLIEIVLEPALFFIAGVLLILLHQKLGILLVICSIINSMSYMAAYAAGDNFFMDKIDEIILNENLKKAFVEDAPEEETAGIRDRGKKPESKEARQRIFDLMDEEVPDVK